MSVLQTSFSVSSLSILPAVTSNPTEVLFDLDAHQRAPDSASDHAFQLVLHTAGQMLGEQFIDVTAKTAIPHFLEADNKQDEIDTIPASYEDRYWLRRPIPVEFEDVAADAVIAHFYEAELAVTGSDRQDAKASLALWVLDIFDDLAAANPQVLGRTPALQIRVLNEYLSRR